MSNPAERRAHPRFASQLELHGTHEEGGVVARMVASNLSLGGLHCVSSSDFPEMTRLAVRLLLPINGNANSDCLDIEAVVVRRRELDPSVNGENRFELSLFFTNLDSDDKGRLTRYLDQQKVASS